MDALLSKNAMCRATTMEKLEAEKSGGWMVDGEDKPELKNAQENDTIDWEITK